jgi:hypothetical protein
MHLTSTTLQRQSRINRKGASQYRDNVIVKFRVLLIVKEALSQLAAFHSHIIHVTNDDLRLQDMAQTDAPTTGQPLYGWNCIFFILPFETVRHKSPLQKTIMTVDAQNLRVAVVGGRPGGLATAIALSKVANVDVKIYEQASILREVGAGVNIGANSWDVLDLLGVANSLTTGHPTWTVLNM